MALVIPDGYAQVTLHYSSVNFVSGSAATVLGFGRELGPDPAGLGTLTNAIRQSFIDHLLPGLDEDITQNRITAATADYSIDVAGAGAGTSNRTAPPPNTTVLLSYRTGRRGPRGRGRSYWPGFLNENQVDEAGNLLEATVTSLGNAFVAFFNQVLTDVPEVDQVILQSTGGQSPPITPPPVVTSQLLSPKVATQRRRLRR